MQAPLDASNARDISRFVICYAPGMLVVDLDTGVTRIDGLAALRVQYQSQFELAPLQQAAVVSSQIGGALVVDRERVRGNPDRPDANILAVYREDGAGLIDRARFPPCTGVAIAPSGGSPPRQTTVFSGIVPNLDVTGTLESDTVIIHPPPCSPADLAEPFGVLNFFDVPAYLTAYVLASPVADFAPPFGALNFFDVSEFPIVYNQGCP